jgi:O-methyltransferase involved in polyketide biosynthesis
VSASPITKAFDTARWVAVYCAWDTARPDAIFNNPYAQSLVGERGQFIR